MIKKIKNISGTVLQLHLHEFQIDEEIEIDEQWYASSVIDALYNNTIQLIVDGNVITDTVQQIEYLKGNLQNVVLSNRAEARIVNCQKGRRLHERFITFKTASQDDYDNTDWQDNDYGDITYIMIDANKQITTNNANAVETWIDFEPTYDYEIAGGAIFVPSQLSGEDENVWELHVVAAPDIPQSLGGNVHLIANPRIKWVKGTWIETDSSVNPANLVYNPTYHTNKVRFVIKHPQGAQTEFQLRLKIYK